MADITDIRSVIHTEKAMNQQGKDAVIVVQTSPRMTKNGLKKVFQEYFGILPLSVNSVRMDGKNKRFRGQHGQRDAFKKFYVKVPESAQFYSMTTA
jgi:large subunit ribosomal protein L23